MSQMGSIDKISARNYSAMKSLTILSLVHNRKTPNFAKSISNTLGDCPTFSPCATLWIAAVAGDPFQNAPT